MPSLGNAILTLRVKGDEFKAGLGKAKTQAETTTKGIGSAFGRAQKSIQGAASKVPVFGGTLASLASPAGLAAAGIGLVVGGLTKMVTKTLDVGRALGTARETTGVATEAWQIYSRAIEETNGDSGALERVVLRLSKSIGDASQGNKAAQAGFDALGLSWEELAEVSPDEAMKRVIGAANESLSATDGASVKAALLGRSYTNLGGFANLTTDEITALNDSVAESAVTMSGDQVTAVDNFDAALRTLRDSVGGVTTGVGSALIPILTQVIKVFNEDLMPPIKDIARTLGPVLMPILKAFYSIFAGNIKTVLVVIADVLKVVGQVLTGDFAGAWKTVQHIAQTVMNGIINVYNNTIGLIPGVSKIDMLQFADNIEIAEDAVKDLAVASGESAAATAETTKVYRDTATEITQIAQQLTVDLEEEGKKRLASAREQMAEDYRIRQEAFAAREQLRKDFLAAEAKFHDDELAALLKSFDVTEVEYRVAQAQVESMTGAHYAELVALAEELGIDNLALLHAHNRNMAFERAEAHRALLTSLKAEIDEIAEQIRTGQADDLDQLKAHFATILAEYKALGGKINAELANIGTVPDASGDRPDRGFGSTGGVAGGSAAARPPPEPITLDPTKGDIVDVHGSVGPGTGFFSTTTTKGNYYNLLDYPGRAADVAAWLAANRPSPSPPTSSAVGPGIDTSDSEAGAPQAQHGAFVKGSRMGSLVRVGENFTDENITPVGGRGGRNGGGQKMEFAVNLGDETLATIYVDGKRVAVREGRD